MLCGSFAHNLDEEGRVSPPSKFREIPIGRQDDRQDDQQDDRLNDQHADQLIVTKFLFDTFCCLDAYPYADWERCEQALNTQSCFNPNFLTLETFYPSRAHTSAHTCTQTYRSVDKHGCSLIIFHIIEIVSVRTLWKSYPPLIPLPQGRAICQ